MCPLAALQLQLRHCCHRPLKTAWEEKGEREAAQTWGLCRFTTALPNALWLPSNTSKHWKAAHPFGIAWLAERRVAAAPREPSSPESCDVKEARAFPPLRGLSALQNPTRRGVLYS